MKNITVIEIRVTADKGSSIGSCLVECMEIAVKEWRNVRLNFNGEDYLIQPNDLLAACIKVPKEPVEVSEWLMVLDSKPSGRQNPGSSNLPLSAIFRRQPVITALIILAGIFSWIFIVTARKEGFRDTCKIWGTGMLVTGLVLFIIHLLCN